MALYNEMSHKLGLSMNTCCRIAVNTGYYDDDLSRDQIIIQRAEAEGVDISGLQHLSDTNTEEQPTAQQSTEEQPREEQPTKEQPTKGVPVSIQYCTRKSTPGSCACLPAQFKFVSPAASSPYFPI